MDSLGRSSPYKHLSNMPPLDMQNDDEALYSSREPQIPMVETDE